MDAFYASVEQRDDPSLRGKPVAVGGSPESRGVVAAASYEARKFGVRSAIPMARAVRLCPELVILRPDFKKYARRLGAGLRDLPQRHAARRAALARRGLPRRHRERAGASRSAWTVARRLKAHDPRETRLTASAGVAPNKFLAKIASGWRKPDGLTVIAPERIERFLQELPVDALWGVGPRHRARSCARPASSGSWTCAPRRTRSCSVRSAAGPNGFAGSPSARTTAPSTRTSERKSVGCEETYAKDLADPARSDRR